MTDTRSEAKVKSFGVNIESDLASRFFAWWRKRRLLRRALWAKGDRKLSDQVATERRCATMDTVPMRGKIVIGEGERDEAPMLYIGEKVGAEFPDGLPGAGNRHRG